MLDEYYHLRGWDGNGIPTTEKLKALGLEGVLKDLLRK
jgi:aldehyde:ferredoxin oxidoreductase